MAQSTAPILIAGGVTFANQWLGKGNLDIRALVGTGVAAAGFALLEQIPGMAPFAAGVAWIAVITVFLTGSPSPAQTITRLTTPAPAPK